MRAMYAFLARHRSLLALLALGIALRVVLALGLFPMQGFAGDMSQFWQWAQALAGGGPGTFYATVSSANYPPGYLYALWLLGIIGNPALLKLPPILADLGIAILAYALGMRLRDRRTGLIAAALFLFLPVSWIDSALWGQVDAAGTLVAMAALLLLVDGWSEAALLAAVLAVLVKPQYAIVLGVVLPVLVRRHLLRVGSGPQPPLGRRLVRLDALLGGLLRNQGPKRLFSSALLAGVIGITVLLPFDLGVYAPSQLADVPVIANITGLMGLFGRLGSEYSVLTANAFNGWALVGSPSLASLLGGASGGWQADSLVVLAGVSAVTLGTALLVIVGVLVAGGLLIREGVVPVLLGFTILALAFFVLPTRVHERYLFPFFASGAVLAAVGVFWVAGFAGAAIVHAANLVAVLSGNLSFGAGTGAGGAGVQGGGEGGAGGGPGGSSGGFGGGLGRGFSKISLPFTDIAQSQLAVTVSAIGLSAVLVALLAAWVVVILRPGAGTRSAAP